MRSFSRFTVGLGVFSCSGMVLWSSAIARGQDQNAPIIIATPAIPTAPTILPAPTRSAVSRSAASNLLVIKPAMRGNGRFDVDASNVSLVKVIEELARLANKKVIISDELRRQPVTISQAFKNQTPVEMMESLTTLQLSNGKAMAWGNAGPDTWLVVLHDAPVFQNRIVRVPAQPHATPPENSLTPIIPYQGRNTLPPDAIPFEFNGGTYYRVPLEK